VPTTVALESYPLLNSVQESENYDKRKRKLRNKVERKSGRKAGSKK
jgi:hypothetical protein